MNGFEENMFDELMAVTGGILKGVQANMCGRSADVSKDYYNTRLAASLAVMAGDGNTLEIGCYFGACAITTALAKRKYNIQGGVYCLDPLDGREQMSGEQTTGHTIDPISGCLISPETFLHNCRLNQVDIVLVAKPSNPFPEELKGLEFASVYIDGDHWHNTPYADFNNVKDNTTRYIVFDDADNAHPHVLDAVDKAMLDKNWKIKVNGTSIIAFERINHE